MAYTISQLARAAAVPTSTVRYYERIGLLFPSGRSESNYRLYQADALERLQFIRAAQASGFSLEDVASLLAFRQGDRVSCRDVQELVKRRMENVEQRISELDHLHRALLSTLEMCRRNEDSGTCATIERLAKTSTSHVIAASSHDIPR